MCATELCYQQQNQQIQKLLSQQATVVVDAGSCATQDCFEQRTSIANMMFTDDGMYTDGAGIYTDSTAAIVSSQTNQALQTMKKTQQQKEQQSKPQQCGWTHLGGCWHNAAVWIDKHPVVKDLVVGAVAVGSFLGCMAATGPEDVVGCGAVSGMAANGLNYLLGAEASGNGSIGGLLLNMGIGAITGALGAGLGAAAGGVAAELLGDAASPVLSGIVRGAAAGTVDGSVTTGGSYLAGCAGDNSCSITGLGKAMLAGGAIGAVAGGFAGKYAAECHSFTTSTPVLMADGSTKAIG